MKFTTVLGVDGQHLKELQLAWKTWKKYKYTLWDNQIIIFYDEEQVDPHELRLKLQPNNFQVVPWKGKYPGTPGDKWSDPQRHKMLAGFVHVPAAYVKTDYWLKLDTDTIATEVDDWIDRNWFIHNPGIVAHKWGLTKPPYQMMKLDCWMKEAYPACQTGSLNLEPKPGETKLKHKRIISWCGFFSTKLTRLASALATSSAPEEYPASLPVCSQDGYMWYLAQRFRFPVERVNMKQAGWDHCSSFQRLFERVKQLEEDQSWNF